MEPDLKQTPEWSTQEIWTGYCFPVINAEFFQHFDEDQRESSSISVVQVLKKASGTFPWTFEHAQKSHKESGDIYCAIGRQIWIQATINLSISSEDTLESPSLTISLLRPTEIIQPKFSRSRRMKEAQTWYARASTVTKPFDSTFPAQSSFEPNHSILHLLHKSHSQASSPAINTQSEVSPHRVPVMSIDIKPLCHEEFSRNVLRWQHEPPSPVSCIDLEFTIFIFDIQGPIPSMLLFSSIGL